MPDARTLDHDRLTAADVDARGEDLLVPERVIVAPAMGVFRPEPFDVVTPEGSPVSAGQVVGRIEASGTATPVTSPFTGVLMGMLAHEGERVREGEPVAWLRIVAA